MNAGNKKVIFESITEKQAWKIIETCKQSQEFDTEKLDTMISDLTKLPFSSIHTLSKQEASWIIDRLQGITKWDQPRPARTSDRIKGGARDLPTLDDISFIRESVQTLGWDKAQFKAWLEKYTKAGNLNELTRETARKAYVGLLVIRRRALEA